MMIEPRKKRPAFFQRRGAIIVHGHRLSSLFRLSIEPWIGYDSLNIIVLKILKNRIFTLPRAQNFLASGGSISATMKGAPV
jgi:hypothetical protein